MRHIYSLVRFVPDPARGEFVNVGAIAGSEESSEWQIRQIENPVRARAVDDNRSLDAVWSFMGSIGSKFDEFEAASESLFAVEEELTEGWLLALHASHQNIVQLSPPTPMVAESAEEALDRVFDLMILDPAVREYRFKKKHTALGAVRAAYRNVGVRKGTELQERVALRTPHHRERLDFAVTNGRALQLTQTWSFQVPDQATLAERVKAWAWTVQDVRNSGGQIGTADGREFDVREDVDIAVVFVSPEPDQPAPAYDDASNVFEELGIEAAPVDEANRVGERARELLGPPSEGELF
jgi:hypothetical protein